MCFLFVDANYFVLAGSETNGFGMLDGVNDVLFVNAATGSVAVRPMTSVIMPC